MKYLCLFAMLLSFSAHSQIVETTIAPESNRDYNARRILLSNESEVFAWVPSGDHRPTAAGISSNCNSNIENGIYKIAPDGTLLATEVSNVALMFYDQVQLSESEYAAIGAFPCTTAWTDPSGMSGGSRGYTLIAGFVDTVGATDSSLNFIASFENPDCDFGLSGYFGTAQKDGLIYALYDTRDGYDEHKYLWKVNPTTGEMQKIPAQENFSRVQEMNDNSGFYALFQKGDNPYKCHLGELKLDGSVVHLSSELSFESQNDLPHFIFSNGMLFTVASNYYKSTDVSRYDLDGSILNTYTTGFRTKWMRMTSVGLLLIQEPITPPRSEDQKPMKISLLDLNLNVIGFEEFGFENLGIQDFHFDKELESLTILGTVRHTLEEDLNQENKKIYFFRAKISDIFPNATAIESLESGRIYPNPSNDSAVFLELKNSVELEANAEFVLRFFDVQGKSVNPSYSKTGPALYEINSSELPAGTYLGVVETADGERVFSQLFVVDR